MDLAYLKQATRAEHEATEAHLPLMKADLTVSEYIEALRGFYAAVAAWDAWSVQHVPEGLRGVLEGRQRSPLLLADLKALGSTVPEHAATFQNCGDRSEAAFLGRMYVVEGSTLGGQYIARHVEETLRLQPGMGDAYFRGYGERTAAMWKAFRAVLEDVPEEQTEAVVQAAREMFGFFGECLSPKNSPHA